VTAFVEECRREWKRLRVPELFAEEMAAELEADLAEAEADGVSAAEMLGESDPRRFAATWAAERGLVPEQPPQRKSRKRLWIWVAVGFVLLVFVLFPMLALVGSESGGGSLRSDNPEFVTPGRRVTVGMKACEAVRLVARTGIDAWRIAGHEHGYGCDLIVVEQTPAPGHVTRRRGHPVTVTLRVSRS
jgi:hypothetical protein